MVGFCLDLLSFIGRTNRIYFAGEAMNTRGKTIAVHGACESAYLAIDTILNSE